MLGKLHMFHFIGGQKLSSPKYYLYTREESVSSSSSSSSQQKVATAAIERHKNVLWDIFCLYTTVNGSLLRKCVTILNRKKTPFRNIFSDVCLECFVNYTPPSSLSSSSTPNIHNNTFRCSYYTFSRRTILT